MYIKEVKSLMDQPATFQINFKQYKGGEIQIYMKICSKRCFDAFIQIY
jgi:hypothetical protein